MQSLRLGQFKVIALLFCGYGALYFCRADLSVGTPLIIDQLGRHGVGHDEAVKRLGDIASIGVFAYAMGKLFLTGLGDFWGGRVSFLIGLAGATACTLLFSLGTSLPLFAAAWFGNRLIQSIAWAGLIKVSSKWFDFSTYGTIAGILSISYLVGDAVARGSMGALIEHGAGWQTLFHYAAGVAGYLLHCELAAVEGIPHRRGSFGSQDQPAQSLRRQRSAGPRRTRTAPAAAAQPVFPHRLRALARLHDNSRDLQLLDTGVFA